MPQYVKSLEHAENVINAATRPLDELAAQLHGDAMRIEQQADPDDLEALQAAHAQGSNLRQLVERLQELVRHGDAVARLVEASAEGHGQGFSKKSLFKELQKPGAACGALPERHHSATAPSPTR